MQLKSYITGLLIFSFFAMSSWIGLQAQETENPFELKHRLQKKSRVNQEPVVPENQNPFDLSHRESLKEKINGTKKKLPDNPFDITRENSQKESSITEPSKVPAPQTKEVKKEESNTFVFWFILLSMVFLALLITIYKSLIIKIYRAFTNDNILKLLHREQGSIIAFPYLLLYILFFINAGAFTFFVFRFFDYIPSAQSFLYFSVLSIGAFFLLKHVLLKIIELIFPVRKEIRIYSFSIVIFSIILGFMLIPFNIISAFAAPGLVKLGIYGGLGTILIVYMFRFLRGLFIASKFITFHKFHFFMYLCAVEIAPVLILAKILMNNAGIH